MSQTPHERRAIETSLLAANRAQRTEAIRFAHKGLDKHDKAMIDFYQEKLRLSIPNLGKVGALEVLAALGQHLNRVMPE